MIGFLSIFVFIVNCQKLNKNNNMPKKKKNKKNFNVIVKQGD